MWTAEHRRSAARKVLRYAALLNELSALAVISARAAGRTRKVIFDNTTCGIAKCPDLPSFSSGKMSIGTGPYKYASFAPNTHLRLTRNDEYWEGAPAWDDVTIPVPNSGAAKTRFL